MDIEADLLALLARFIIVHVKQLPIIACYDVLPPQSTANPNKFIGDLKKNPYTTGQMQGTII